MTKKEKLRFVERLFSTMIQRIRDAESRGFTARASELLVNAEVAYSRNRKCLRLNAWQRHWADCRHAIAAGEPIIKGGQGRSGCDVEGSMLAAAGFFLLAGVAVGVYLIFTC